MKYKRTLRLTVTVEATVTDDRFLSSELAMALRAFSYYQAFVNGCLMGGELWQWSVPGKDPKTVATVTLVGVKQSTSCDGWPMWLLNRLPRWCIRLLVPD